MSVDVIDVKRGGLIGELWRDESGQDVIEYGLLAAIIGIAGVVLFPIISGKMATAYVNWNTASQDAWEPCPPGGCP